MPTTISILVFVASPLDYARYRHTALFFDFVQPTINPQRTDSGVALDEKQNQNENVRKGSNTIESEPIDTDSHTPNSSSPSSSHNYKTSLMEVLGSPGFFRFSQVMNTDIPRSSKSMSSLSVMRYNLSFISAHTNTCCDIDLARIIPVASVPTAPPPALCLITADTPIPVDDPEKLDWNSQNWVADALERLVTAGYLDPKAKDRALDEMVDAVLEAGDEEIA